MLKLADGSTAVTGILRTDSGKTKADGTFTTVDNVTVKNLSLDGNSSKTTGDVDGFYTGPKPGTAQADTNITLDGVEIKNCSRYGFDPHEQTIGLTIKNSSAHHNGVDGFTIDFCSQVTLLNNVAFANGRHGFNIVTGSHDVTMTGNNAYDNGGSGISLQTGDNEIRGWTDSIHISGGMLTNNGRGGIEIKQASHIDIDHVVITGNAMDAVMLSGVESVSLVGNTYAGNGGLVRIEGYLQDFNDADPLNDRWVATHNVWIDGVLQADPAVSGFVTLWDYVVTTGDDIISGSAGRDVMAADSGNDVVNGNGGNDSLYGNDGMDTLDGGAGNDKLYGGAGRDRLMYSSGVDTLDGGSSYDTADFSRALGAVVVNMTASGYEATMGGIGVADFVGIENLKGSSYGDTLIGDTAANAIDGGGGADFIDASAGNDSIIGGGGNDQLTGGLGDDVLTGGTGSDVYFFNLTSGFDQISDFTRKQDKIDMTGVADISQLVITQVGTDTDIAYGSAHVLLLGVSAVSLTASDFIFH